MFLKLVRHGPDGVSQDEFVVAEVPTYKISKWFYREPHQVQKLARACKQVTAKGFAFMICDFATMKRMGEREAEDTEKDDTIPYSTHEPFQICYVCNETGKTMETIRPQG